MIVTINFEVMN